MDSVNTLIKYPAAERNKGPILSVLSKVINKKLSHSETKQLSVLEIGRLLFFSL